MFFWFCPLISMKNGSSVPIGDKCHPNEQNRKKKKKKNETRWGKYGGR
jgi:hypothetical protein